MVLAYRERKWPMLQESKISWVIAKEWECEKWPSFLDPPSSPPSFSPLSFSSLSCSAKGSWAFCLETGADNFSSDLLFVNEKGRKLIMGRAMAENKKTIINPREMPDLCLFTLCFTRQMYVEKMPNKKNQKK
jgi:hypothetical protein